MFMKRYPPAHVRNGQANWEGSMKKNKGKRVMKLELKQIHHDILGVMQTDPERDWRVIEVRDALKLHQLGGIRGVMHWLAWGGLLKEQLVPRGQAKSQTYCLTDAGKQLLAVRQPAPIAPATAPVVTMVMPPRPPIPAHAIA